MDQKAQDLDVVGVGEKVEGLDITESVAPRHQAAHVPGPGAGVAGNVDDLTRWRLAEGFDQIPVEDASRRVEDNQIGGEESGDVFCVVAVEGDVFPAELGRVFLPDLDRPAVDLHRDDLSKLLGQHEA